MVGPRRRVPLLVTAVCLVAAPATCMRVAMPSGRRARAGQYSCALLTLFLVTGGCAAVREISSSLAQLSEEGGLVGRLFADDEPSRDAPVTTRKPDEPGLPVPYQPADFRQHDEDQKFAWHWTATRAGERVEVRGLIANKGPAPVQGVSFELSGPGGRGYADSPGLIPPGRSRPFFFAVALSGNEQPTRLSVVGVDRNVVASNEMVTEPPAAADVPARFRFPWQRAPQPSPAAQFSQHVEDPFFSLHWSTTNKEGGEVEIRGLLENRDGPMMQAVTILVSPGPGGESVKPKRLLVLGPVDKRAFRPFAVTLSAPVEPEHVSVAVESYEFYHPSAGGD